MNQTIGAISIKLDDLTIRHLENKILSDLNLNIRQQVHERVELEIANKVNTILTTEDKLKTLIRKYIMMHVEMEVKNYMLKFEIENKGIESNDTKN